MKPHGSKKALNIALFLFVNVEAWVFLLGFEFLFASAYGRTLTMATVGLTATTGLPWLLLFP